MKHPFHQTVLSPIPLTDWKNTTFLQ